MRVQFTRTHPLPSGPAAAAAAERVDALLWSAMRSGDADEVSVSASGAMTLGHDRAVAVPDLERLLGAGIRATVTQETPDGRDAAGDPRTLRLTLEVSDAPHAADVLQAVQELVAEHRRWRNDRLGRGRWFFEEIPARVFRTVDGKVNWSTVPAEKTYAMYPLRTNKTLGTLFGDHVDVIRRRARFFRDRADWYRSRGVPHTLGILLYGEPGCGKTSAIKALSAELDRHVFSIRLDELTSRAQLHAAFFSPSVRATRSAHPAATDAAEEYEIPIERRILVVEDADCLAGAQAVLGRRTGESPTETEDGDEGIRLGDVLNAIDGVLETPGRVLVLTSNRPEALDPALLRPGRMDVRVRLGRASAACLGEICRHFRDGEVPGLDDLDGRLTIAEATAAVIDTREDAPAATLRALHAAAEDAGGAGPPARVAAATKLDWGLPSEDEIADSPLF